MVTSDTLVGMLCRYMKRSVTLLMKMALAEPEEDIIR